MRSTPEQFDQKLEDIVSTESAGVLLAIPGIYEVLSEHYNNQVLRELAEDEQEANDRMREERLNATLM